MQEEGKGVRSRMCVHQYSLCCKITSRVRNPAWHMLSVSWKVRDSVNMVLVTTVRGEGLLCLLCQRQRQTDRERYLPESQPYINS